MAEQQMQTPKRRRADQVELEDDQPESQVPPAKRVKTARRSKPNFPPEFWDKLSKVSATSRALRELDRRNNALPVPTPPRPAVPPTDLERFARHGGPDLRHLRGCPLPRAAMDVDRPEMSSNYAASESAATETTGAKATRKVRRSSAYDVHFERHMADHGIYMPYRAPAHCPKPNIAEIRLQLSARRPSLSPSRFDDTAFEEFRRLVDSDSETSNMAKIIRIIAGTANIPNERNLEFTNALPLAGGLTETPAPDFFDGAAPGDLHTSPRYDLSKLVVPTKHANVPVAPNFFLEAKSDKGTLVVADRQACFDGAYGARAMHHLKNYRDAVQTYTAEVHAISSAYCGRSLVLYVHHIAAPTGSGGQPEYLMTEVDCWYIRGDREVFVEAVTAFRNARDVAQRHRDQLIQNANAKARRANPPLFDEAPTVTGNRDAGEDLEDPPHPFPDGDELGHEPGSGVLGPNLGFATSNMPVNGPLSPPRSMRIRVSGSPPSDAQRQKKQSLN